MEEKTKERIHYFDNIAKKKGYRNETIELALMFACTKELVRKYGSEENALEEIIKLCEKYDDGKAFINAVGVLAGLDDM